MTSVRVALGRWLAPAAAVLVSASIYLPWPVLTGAAVLRGMDYGAIHERRLAYARDAVAHGEGVPGWSPREFLGAPFAANSYFSHLQWAALVWIAGMLVWARYIVRLQLMK